MQGMMGVLEALRGPNPPAAVCGCGAVVLPEWVNPVLVTAKKLGRYTGDVRGGVLACERCRADFEDRQAARTGGGRREAVKGAPAWAERISLESAEVRAWNKRAIDRVSEWSTARNRDLYLFGPTGTGKTHLAIAAGRAAAADGVRSVLFARVPALLREIRDGFGGDQAGGGALGRAIRAELLILDDLGAEHATEFAASTIEGLYSERLDAGRRTVITSNLPLAISEAGREYYQTTLSEYLGDDRLASRVAGFCELIELVGEDFRLSGWRGRGGKV